MSPTFVSCPSFLCDGYYDRYLLSVFFKSFLFQLMGDDSAGYLPGCLIISGHDSRKSPAHLSQGLWDTAPHSVCCTLKPTMLHSHLVLSACWAGLGISSLLAGLPLFYKQWRYVGIRVRVRVYSLLSGWHCFQLHMLVYTPTYRRACLYIPLAVVSIKEIDNPKLMLVPLFPVHTVGLRTLLPFSLCCVLFSGHNACNFVTQSAFVLLV